MERTCDVCKKRYNADMRNIKRGWGLCCSKSCAAKKRERLKPGYNPVTVAENNRKREDWYNYDIPINLDPGDDEYWDNKDFR